MVFLGIDPGWANCGFAVVETGPGTKRTHLRQAWTWRPRSRGWVNRCWELASYVDRTLGELGEGVRVGLETVQWHGRRTGLIRLSITVGVLWGVAIARRVADVRLYSPRVVKGLGLPRGWRAVDEHARDAAVLACLAAGRPLSGRSRRARGRCSGRLSFRPVGTRVGRRRLGRGFGTTAARSCGGSLGRRRRSGGGERS